MEKDYNAKPEYREGEHGKANYSHHLKSKVSK